MDRKSLLLATLCSAVVFASTSHAQTTEDGSFLIQESSGKCLSPANTPFDPNARTQVVFNTCEGLPEQRFRWLDNGSIQHVVSGRCIKPEGPLNDVNALDRIKLAPRCGGARMAFKHTRKGAVRHIESGLCVHPERGNLQPEDGTRALLKGACGKEKAFFAFTDTLNLDSDGDGVEDAIDQCPNTPAGVEVDANGCQVFGDGDNDGVPDNLDQCPFTPEDFRDIFGITPEGCVFIPEFEDQDGDAVINLEDQCPDTPLGEEVDVAGCSASQRPTDSDGDGVFDEFDECPMTPPNTPVDGNGCAILVDTDHDGIPDALDACPFTPEQFAGSVGPDGCFPIPELEDQDGDGIFNVEDQCPDTPRNEEADFTGCSVSQRPVDSDNDGVPDDADECPNTPPGVPVDGSGCPLPEEDSDNDGVPDFADECPFTPAEFRDLFGGVQPNGCLPVPDFEDQDGDGVINIEDQCPGTPLGEEVNVDGCPITQSIDSDFDGLTDDQEFELGTNPFNPDSDFDNLSDGEEVNVFGTNPLNPDTDFGGVQDFEEILAGTNPLDPSDDRFGPPSLPLVLNDGHGFSWDIFDGGEIADGTRDAFDGGFLLSVNGMQFFREEVRFDNNGRGVLLTNRGMLPGIEVSRHVSVPEGAKFARFIDSFTNTGSQLQVLEVTLSTNLGSDNATNVLITSSGDQVFDVTDQYIITDDGFFFPSSSTSSFGSSSSIPFPFPIPSSTSSFSFSSTSSVPSFPTSSSESFGSVSSAPFIPTSSSEPEFGSSSSVLFSEPSFSSSDFEFSSVSSEPSFGSSSSELVIVSSSSTPIIFPPFSSSSSSSSFSSLPFFEGDPMVGHVFNWFNGETALQPVAAFQQGDNIQITYRIVLRPGETTSIMSLGFQGFDRNVMEGDIDEAISNLPKLLQDLTPVQVMDIGNWFPSRDSDGDGILDDQEAVLGTDRFNPDSDFDGRPDLEDVLTEFNPELAFDLDSDGIPDFADQCIIESPFPVDKEGCPITEPDPCLIDPASCRNDSDNDGVPDDFDLCPGTPFGVEVDSRGCPIVSPGIEIIDANPARINPVFPPELGLTVFDIGLFDLITDQPIPRGASIELEFIDGRFNIFQQSPELLSVIVETFDPNETQFFIPVFIALPDGSRSNTFFVEARTGDVPPVSNEADAVFIRDAATINASEINLSGVFAKLAAEGNGSGESLFRQFWDAQRTTSAIGSDINCVPINGFELSCDRLESDVAFMSEAQIAVEMTRYNTLALVNRIELRTGWQDCGEHRVIFGRNDFQRNFLIVEARVPNPTPGDIRGCEPVIRHWQSMPNLDPVERGIELNRFFMEGLEGIAPVISVANLSQGQGQIRTNQFMTPEWMLREYDLATRCNSEVAGDCTVVALPVRVNENPFGELFNPELPFIGGALAELAADFQAEFASNLEPLLKDDIVMLSNPVSDRFNNGQSHASGFLFFENDFRGHFGSNLFTPFGLELQAQLEGRVDARGNPLTVDQLLNRATAMTCGGCHEPSSFGLTVPNAIGAFRLSDGTIIDSWPNTLGFVHVDEQRNISPALRNVFIPARLEAFGAVLEELDFAISTGFAPENLDAGPRINER